LVEPKVWSAAPCALAVASAVALGVACGDGASSSGTARSGVALGSASAPVRGGAPVGPPAVAREGGALSRSPIDAVVYVADEDHSVVRAAEVPLVPGAGLGETQVPGRPAEVLATRDHVLVTVREVPGGKGALLVMDRAGKLGLTERARIELPVDAWGLAISPDESLAVVTSAWSAKVSVVDLAAGKVLSTVDVGREPRGVTVLAGDTAFVSHLVGSAVTRIDELREAVPAVTRVELPPAPSRAPKTLTLGASLGYATLASPDGTRVFFPRHALGALGRTLWWGASAVDVLDAKTSKPFAPVRKDTPRTLAPMFVVSDDQMSTTWWDTSDDVFEGGNRAFTQPRAAVFRKRTRTLLVAGEGSNSVAELDALMSDPTHGLVRTYDLERKKREGFDLFEQGGAPSGLALSADEGTLWVYCRSTDELVEVTLPEGEGSFETAPPRYEKLVPTSTDRDAVMGRQLFYDAGYHVVSGGLGCAACHPEGRDDGFVWRETKLTSAQTPGFTNFFGSLYTAAYLQGRWPNERLEIEGAELPQASGHARQTPMLAGRVKAKGPYGWLGESKDLEARIAGGFGLHRWETDEASDGLKIAVARMIAKYLREGLVPPPAHVGPLTQLETEGKRIFESPEAACATCHTSDGGEYSNRSLAALALLAGRTDFVAEKNAAYKTPSLLFVGGSAPYFHDGRYATLEELVDQNGAQMGKTSHLDAAQKKALVAYLRTL
jgi:YVTN family beta-propeller protein